jgi:deoxyribodipyrimidine photo-lyase
MEIPSSDINLKIVENYTMNRDFPSLNGTSKLGIHLRFGTIGIRELARQILSINETFLNELIWRDFYYGLNYFHPFMLQGQTNGINKAYRAKFDKIKWNNDEDLFDKWKNGKLGIPICDSGMNQLRLTGFLHNRLRMICANILTKLLLIDWRKGEMFFAQNLIDYDSIQNNAGFQWTCCGIDPAQPFRIFNPSLQIKKFDKECIFIKKYIPELIDVSSDDIIMWETEYYKYPKINYPPPQINYKKSRQNAITEYKKVNIK